MKERLKNYQNLSPYEVIQTHTWRSDYRIRKFMFDKKSFSLKAHKEFIEYLYYPYIKVSNIGSFNLIPKNNFIELGLFKNPNKTKVGKILLKEALIYAKKYYPNKKIILYVYKHNKKAINLYKKFGFKIINKDKNLLKMELTNANRKIQHKR